MSGAQVIRLKLKPKIKIGYLYSVNIMGISIGPNQIALGPPSSQGQIPKYPFPPHPENLLLPFLYSFYLVPLFLSSFPPFTQIGLCCWCIFFLNIIKSWFHIFSKYNRIVFFYSEKHVQQKLDSIAQCTVKHHFRCIFSFKKRMHNKKCDSIRKNVYLNKISSQKYYLKNTYFTIIYLKFKQTNSSVF